MYNKLNSSSSTTHYIILWIVLLPSRLSLLEHLIDTVLHIILPVRTWRICCWAMAFSNWKHQLPSSPLVVSSMRAVRKIGDIVCYVVHLNPKHPNNWLTVFLTHWAFWNTVFCDPYFHRTVTWKHCPQKTGFLVGYFYLTFGCKNHAWSVFLLCAFLSK